MPGESGFAVELADQQSDLEVNQQRLVEAVRHVLESEFVVSAEISLALVDSDTMQELNRQYLQHDYDTDVLSFLLEADPEFPTDPDHPGSGRRLEGEVIVSVGMARQQAPQFEWSPEDELLLYVVHGVLHLTGYDDQTDAARALMRQRERKLLAGLGLEVSYREDADAADAAEKLR